MTLNRPEKKFDRFFEIFGLFFEDFDEGANTDSELEGRDISDGGERGDGQKLEWSGEVGVVDVVDLVNPVEAELTDSVSHDLVRYESRGSRFGSV